MSQARLRFGSGRRNLFIEAGAGTGKTTRIVKEVLAILLDDPRQLPDRIVLITFTEKAAGEIAERIRDALIDLRASFEEGHPGWPSGSTPPILRVPPEKEAAWRTACDRHLQHLDRIRSQTIHAFCQSILTQAPFEAGLDPSFRIVEGFERGRILDEIWREWVEDETGGTVPDERAADWEHALDVLEGLDGLREVVMQLVPHRALLEDETRPLARFAEVAGDVKEAADALRSVDGALIEELVDPLAVEVLQYVRRERPPVEHDPDAWLRWLEPIAHALRSANLPRRKELKEPFRVLRGKEKKENLYDLLRSERAAAAVHRLALRFLARLEAEKDRRGVLDFDDLLVRTERLLRDPMAAAAIRSRFDYLFVDEFQDTDRLQARIVDRLARNDAGELEPGRVVLVGDPKQSIYSFRGADPETYGEMLSRFIAGGAETPKLGDQFRSRPELVAALNTMFGRLFSEPAEENVFRPGYTELTAARRGGSGAAGPPLRFLRAAVGAPGPASPETTTELQAEAVASAIRARAAGGERLESFAILLRKMTDVAPYLDALERAGIEFVLPRNSSVLDRRAAVDLLAVLRAVAAPFDRGAEISAARTPWFALTDAEIAEGKLAWERGAALSEDAPWTRFRATIRSWRALARRLSVADLIDRIAAARGIETFYRLVHRGEEALEDLDAVRELARRFDREIGGSVALFVEEMLRRRDGAAEADPAIIDEAARGVRILTVHASKGLEFDTVILPDLGAATASDTFAPFTLETPARLFFRGRLTTAATALLDAGGKSPAEISKQRNEAEVERLFYVAVTRAREEVVFVLDPGQTSRSGFLKPFFRIFDLDPKGLDSLWPDGAGARLGQVAVGGCPIPVVFERAAPLPAGEAPPSRLVDRALEARLGEVPPLDAPPADEEIRTREELYRDAAALRRRTAGILLHRVLEVWDGEGDPDVVVGRLAAEVAADPADQAKVRARLAALARSPVWARIRAAETVGRETTIQFLEEGRPREGRIDRLLRENGAWLVVDYKSGRPAPARVDRDRAQVEAYRRAIAALTGQPCRGLLWYLDTDEETAVEIGG